MKFERAQRLIVGPPRDPLDPDARRRLRLAALLAWAGLGANGLSAACYGPEKAFVALGTHVQLGPLLAVATALTVGIIALAYSQVIELFPTGGGNYKVVSQLFGPRWALVSGAALLVDYVLTIAVSLVSGTDALFSVLAPGAQVYKVAVEVGLVVLLIVLNLRGMQESIRFLLPVVVGFLLLHGFLIVYGIASRASGMGLDISHGTTGIASLSGEIGWPMVAVLFLRAYALGGSTYTGVEAVSNNVNLLAEPRVRTGRTTLLYVALSLGFTAGGLILLYTLWRVQPAYGQTLNAVVFSSVIAKLGVGALAGHAILLLTLALEGALLLVAANSILIFAPSLLATMAGDSWLPHRFANLSHRLVRQNGVIFVGGCAFLILIWTHGSLGLLVVLYSINVFLSLALAKFGLLRHWCQGRHTTPNWLGRAMVAAVGFGVASWILVVTLTEKFFEGGWATVCLTCLVIACCATVRRHYQWVEERRAKMDALFATASPALSERCPIGANPQGSTAVVLVTEHWGLGVHTVLWISRLFPGRFQNVAFVSVVRVEGDILGPLDPVQQSKRRIDASLDQLEAFCAQRGMRTARVVGYGTDPVAELERLLAQALARFPEPVCFSNTLILPARKQRVAWLHNQTALALQARLHIQGIPLVVLPITLA
jgi:amino acid transporter